MSKEVSKELHANDPEQTFQIVKSWVESTGIYERIQFKLDDDNKDHQKLKDVIVQFELNNYQFCAKNILTEQKMVVMMEIMHYILRELIDIGENLTEDQSFTNFKELLLRHAVHRPPHSLAIFTFEEVKKIDLYA